MAEESAGRVDEIKRFRFVGDAAAVDANIRADYGFEGDLLSIYSQNVGQVVHKWHHYLPLYDRYFSAWRGTKVRFLEIGVSKGGSLQMWRKYFGPDAMIFGIDIDPRCAEFDGQAGQVRIGSQDDPEFLNAVVAEMGGVDVILDDGSHEMPHINASLKVLFPQLAMGGTYMIEDLHTAYWRRFGGSYARGGNFFNEVRKMIDDMHQWYHGKEHHDADRAMAISGIHVHDSIVVIDKQPVHRPTHSKVGK